jgi:hypothetical protein
LSWGEWPPWGHGILRDVGIALLTTAVLGFTVDRWLKLDIAVDVFRAALGYVLPDEFRDEVRRISNYKLVAEKHVLIFEIEQLDADTVRAVCMLERIIKNISSESQPYNALVAADEWGFPNAKSEIFECEVRDEAGNTDKFQHIENDGGVLKTSTNEIFISPQGRAFGFLKFSEIRRTNDHIMGVSTLPTKNPEIEVKISPNFEYSVSFGHPVERVQMAKYSPRHTMLGTYFPNQPMRVRWRLKT